MQPANIQLKKRTLLLTMKKKRLNTDVLILKEHIQGQKNISSKTKKPGHYIYHKVVYIVKVYSSQNYV